MESRRLAHCKQMNHSAAFWAVRNQYAEQMRGLWARGYVGEGLWGRGKSLATGAFESNAMDPGEQLPEHLCGGTYRSRGKKRKAGKKAPPASYREQKERRILKKFGANGVALGEDVEVKTKLEKGKRVASKPRVAGSNRGRELRAAAALARFDQNKKEDEEEVVEVISSGEETESGDEYEDGEDAARQTDAVDVDGKRLVDSKGRGMIKVCEDENPDDVDVKQELDELFGFRIKSEDAEVSEIRAPPRGIDKGRTDSKKPSRPTGWTPSADDKRNQGSRAERLPNPPGRSKQQHLTEKVLPKLEPRKSPKPKEPTRPRPPPPPAAPPPPAVKPEESDTNPRSCLVCSFANDDRLATICAVCSNVLDPARTPGSWACNSGTCRGGQYRNSRDSGICGVCGERKPR